ncbi:hypothetical protein [Maritalea sp.]|uniref:hypothetical protein n=1 Tax=Maritalea sp. TaxID=2003361 RepID=UPI0039E37CDE
MRKISLAALLISLVFIPVFYWWFQIDIIWLAGFSLFSIASAFAVPFSYHLLGFEKRDQQRVLKAREQANYERILTDIRTISINLNDVGEEEASKQSARLLGMVDDYHEVITKRFADSPLSVSSHAEIAQRVQNIVVQNLSDLVVIARSVAGIDREDLVASKAETSGTDVAIDRRLELADTQRAKMDEIIDANRTLLTALAETLVEVANIQKQGAAEHDDAVLRLRELADRAKKFHI